jgi:hypothetical protein
MKNLMSVWAQQHSGIVLLFGAILLSPAPAFSGEAHNDGGGYTRSDSTSSAANHEPSESDRMRSSINATELYRQKIAKDIETLTKEEAKLEEITSTRPAQHAQDEMDQAPIGQKGQKRDEVFEAVEKMTDPATQQRLDSVREQKAAKEKELKETEINISGQREHLNSVIKKEAQQHDADHGHIGNGHPREVPGNDRAMEKARRTS